MDLAYDQLQRTDVSIEKSDNSGQTAEAGGSADGTTSSSSNNKEGAPAAAPTTSIDRAAERLETGIETAFTRMSAVVSQSSTSAWGTKLGGFWSKVKQQGGVALQEAGKDFQAVRNELDDLLTSTATSTATKDQQPQNKSLSESQEGLASSVETLKVSGTQASTETAATPQKPTNMLALLTKKAQIYIDELDRDLEVVENTAGSYLTQFGTDLKSYLKDAVNVAPPRDGPKESGSSSGNAGSSEVLFNVPEDIRNQIYSTRLDAQLHALHTSPEPFLVSPDSAFEPFQASFNVDSQTDRIASDLETYPKLRTLMESLVPAKVSYADFWTRYYFMREQISGQEEKRKALLKQASDAAAASSKGGAEDFNWDDDDEEEEETTTTAAATTTTTATKKPETASEKQVTDTPTTPTTTAAPKLNSDSPTSIKSHPTSGSSRPSSESSYDLVSKTASVIDLPGNTTTASSSSTSSSSTSTATTSTVEATPAAATGSKDSAKSKPGPSASESDSDDDWE